jgi:hypothetical protein
MKFKLLAVICLTQLLTSCSKSGGGSGGSGGSGGGTPTPTGGSKGYIRVTFGGKTLEARDTILYKGTSSEYFFPLQGVGATNTYLGGGYFQKGLVIQSNAFSNTNGNLDIVLVLIRDSSTNINPVDTYNLLGIGNRIRDLATSTTYPIDMPSTGTVTYSDDFYIEGTLNLTLIGSGGTKIPATGTFKKYYK